MKAPRRTLCLLVVISILGCGDTTPKESTAPVSGVVTYNGTPVEGATVVFGADSGQPKSATAITDASGRFELSTYQKADGAIPGSYSVAISKIETIPGMTEDEEHEAISAGKEVRIAETKQVLPAKYGDSKKSGLKADVSADGANEFEFALTD